MGQQDGVIHPQGVDISTHGDLAAHEPGGRTLLRAVESDAVRSIQCLIDALPDPVVIKDTAHRWVAVNDAVCVLAGRTRDEILGRTSFDFFPHAQAQAQWAADDEVLDGAERPIGALLCVRRRAGFTRSDRVTVG